MEINKECISMSVVRMYKIIYAMSFYNENHKTEIKIVTKNGHYRALTKLWPCPNFEHGHVMTLFL